VSYDVHRLKASSKQAVSSHAIVLGPIGRASEAGREHSRHNDYSRQNSVAVLNFRRGVAPDNVLDRL
jgi:hypothetical protein